MFWILLAIGILVAGIVLDILGEMSGLGFVMAGLVAALVMVMGLTVTDQSVGVETVISEYSTVVGENDTGFVPNTPIIFYPDADGQPQTVKNYSVTVVNPKGVLVLRYERVRQQRQGFFVYEQDQTIERVTFTLE